MSKSDVKNKTIEQYCSVCKKTFQMKVVDDSESNEVLWLKCPGCEGFLPYMTGMDSEGEDGQEETDKGKYELTPEDLTLEEKKNALVYNQLDEYKIDDIIYHRSWNDYGKVIEKETLPGGRKTIIVQFVDQGRTRLLEGVK
jgi:hypothetical protein